MSSAAISFIPVGDEDAIKLPITPAWRAAFKEAFDNLPQGDKQKVAEYAHCSSSLLSRIAAGLGDSSECLDRISEYLKIPPPVMPVDSLLQASLIRLTNGMSEEDLNLLISNANRMKR